MNEHKKIAPEAATSEGKKTLKSTSIITQAKEKIKTSSKAKLSNKAKAIEKATANALKLFCEQSEEFARAIVESNKTFDDCLTEIVKGIGNSISDFDVYSKAVEFYFPGAKIEFKMLIRMSEYELDEPLTTTENVAVKPKESIALSLDSLLDW